MQIPVYGNVISIKNLKKCLEELDENDYLLVDDHKNLAICKLEYFPKERGGRLKEVKSDHIINFFSEEILLTKNYLESLEEDRAAKWGYGAET